MEKYGLMSCFEFACSIGALGEAGAQPSFGVHSSSYQMILDTSEEASILKREQHASPSLLCCRLHHCGTINLGTTCFLGILLKALQVVALSSCTGFYRVLVVICDVLRHLPVERAAIAHGDALLEQTWRKWWT
eukprot:4721358-Amphidinium_carterae.2